jgi:hypothetical protein
MIRNTTQANALLSERLTNYKLYSNSSIGYMEYHLVNVIVQGGK